MSVVRVEKDYDDLSLTLIADFDAPVERVWQLWADPRQLERWWGPPSHPSTVEKHSLAAGGEVAYFMTGPDGETSRGWWRVRTRMELRFAFADRAHMERLERWGAFAVFPQSVGQMDNVLQTQETH